MGGSWCPWLAAESPPSLLVFPPHLYGFFSVSCKDTLTGLGPALVPYDLISRPVCSTSANTLFPDSEVQVVMNFGRMLFKSLNLHCISPCLVLATLPASFGNLLSTHPCTPSWRVVNSSVLLCLPGHRRGRRVTPGQLFLSPRPQEWSWRAGDLRQPTFGCSSGYLQWERGPSD